MNPPGFTKALASASTIAPDARGEAEGQQSTAPQPERATDDPGVSSIHRKPEPPAATRAAGKRISVEEAMAAVAAWKGEEFPRFGLHWIGIALADEVERLRAEIAATADLERRESAAWRKSYWMVAAEVVRLREAISRIQEQFPAAEMGLNEGLKAAQELARFRAALPEIIGCALYADPANCAKLVSACCVARRAAERNGLLPASERPAQEDDGA